MCRLHLPIFNRFPHFSRSVRFLSATGQLWRGKNVFTAAKRPVYRVRLPVGSAGRVFHELFRLPFAREIKFSARSFVRSFVLFSPPPVFKWIFSSALISSSFAGTTVRDFVIRWFISLFQQEVLYSRPRFTRVRSPTHVSAEFNRNSAGVTLFPLIWVSLVF